MLEVRMPADGIAGLPVMREHRPRGSEITARRLAALARGARHRTALYLTLQIDPGALQEQRGSRILAEDLTNLQRRTDAAGGRAS
jgi:hypothetical protein